jgi:predicted transcriptional regulator
MALGQLRLQRLPAGSRRLTLSYMNTVVTIRLDRELARRLASLARKTGRSRSDLVRDALRRQLALMQFEGLRRKTLPFAEARGYLTDEDVFRDVS